MPQPIIIAVMGVAGTGKSSFIQTLTGQDAGIGKGLESKTSEVKDYHATISGQYVILLDTPGFDDTNRSDTEILHTILAWLQTSNYKGVMLSGLIYLHRITDDRMSGTMLVNLGILKSLCGERAYKNIVLTSGRWEEAKGDPSIQQRYRSRHDNELKGGYWKLMLDQGAQDEKYDGTKAATMRIVKKILDNNRPQKLQAQEELEKPGATIAQTSVGNQVAEKSRASAGRWQADIANLKEILEGLMNQALQRVAAEHQSTLRRMQARYEQETQNLTMYHQAATRSLENKIYLLENRLQRECRACLIM